MGGKEAIAFERKTAPFVMMAKPVGSFCNLACDYCYYLETERFNPSLHPYRMSDSLLEMFVRQYIEASPGPVVQFTWHGGEPTLAGLDFYRLAMDLQKKYLPKGWTAWNNLQTNGILLDDDWCSFLAENRFDVGLSLDGTQKLHDQHRKDYGGHGSYARAAEAVRRLQAHGIQPDLLCTVTSSIAREPLPVYQTLRAFSTGWIQFIPIVRRTDAGQVTDDSVTGDAYGDFLCAVFDEWISHDLGKLEIQLFAELSLILAGGKANVCQMSQTCGRVLVIEHDGSVFACDHFVKPEYRLGDIAHAELREIADLPMQRQFGNDKYDRLPAECRGCAYLAYCQGGCPKDRFIQATVAEPAINYLCSGFRKFFAHAEQPLQKVVQLRKRGFVPEAIMAELRADTLARWKGVGRNDLCPCGSGRKAKYCCWSKRPQGF